MFTVYDRNGSGLEEFAALKKARTAAKRYSKNAGGACHKIYNSAGILVFETKFGVDYDETALAELAKAEMKRRGVK